MTTATLPQQTQQTTTAPPPIPVKPVINNNPPISIRDIRTAPIIEPRSRPSNQIRQLNSPSTTLNRNTTRVRASSGVRSSFNSGGLARNIAADAAIEASYPYAEALGYTIGGFAKGLSGQSFSNEDRTDFPEYDIPVKQGIDAGLKAREIIKNTLSKVPSFEIPQVKIPELKLPQIPKIELPKLPELPQLPQLPQNPQLPQIPQLPQLPQLPQFPRLQNPFPRIKPPTPTPPPKPRPYPKTKADELRELTPGRCGNVVFKFAYIDKVIGERYEEGTGRSIAITIPTSIEEYLGKWRELVPSTRESSNTQLLESGGGFEIQYNTELNYEIQIVGFNDRLSLNGSSVGFPYYRHISYGIVVRNGINTSAVLSYISSIREPLIYEWAVDNPTREGCYIPPPPPEPSPPSPPPPKCEDECMCCDPQKQENNDELLKLILRRIGNLPAQIPNKLTDRSAGRKTVNSLSEFMAQQIRLLDDLMGYFPLEIEIEDSDLTEQGSQARQIKVPNVAEALTELIGLALVLRTESSANLSATLRALIEIGSTKQVAILAQDYAKANADFLSYEGRQIEHKVPFSFTPGKAKIDELLQEGEVRVTGFENVDKNDFKQNIYPLLELASRWNAQNYRNLGTKDPLTTLKNVMGGVDVVKQAAEYIKKSKEGMSDNNPQKAKKEEFDQFLENAENGFNTQDGINNPENPYGYPYNERPRLRELGKTYKENEGNNQ